MIIGFDGVQPKIYSLTSHKGQALANFLDDHPCIQLTGLEEKTIDVCGIELTIWKIWFNGFSTELSTGAGVVIKSQNGYKTYISIQFDFTYSNNQAEYEAIWKFIGDKGQQNQYAKRFIAGVKTG